VKDIPLAEERAEGFTALLVDIVAQRCAHTTWYSQAPYLIAIFVSRRARWGIYCVQEANVIDVELIWGDADDGTYRGQFVVLRSDYSPYVPYCW